jgi:nucleoside 2-deoxyribosyltransferase
LKLYLAGPMTGIPKFNFPTFEAWCVKLRAVGFEVLSPHEADPGETQRIAWTSETGDPAELPPGDGPLETALRNVEGVGGCDGVALIDGWHKSSGTVHEIATANRFRLPVAPAVMWEFLGDGGACMAFNQYK